ncbi:hypothetical protein [Streptomyces sp. NPDC058989]|uniref:hypothetical protein n=1 Tax=Streptomyces sp. NPDC058989 TaxID=3346686 RepID=UPI00367666B2
MPIHFNVYGLREKNLSEAERLISNTLEVEFTARESSFKGGEYFSHRDSNLEITIESNFADDEGILSVPEFPQYPTLIFVGYVTSEVERRLNAHGEIDLLRTEAVE